MRARQWQAALESADAAIAILEPRAEAHVVRARALGALSRSQEAVASIARALELSPAAFDDAEDGADAAEISAHAGEWPLSARILDRVLGRLRAPGMRRNLYVLYGDVLLTLGPDRLNESVAAYREAMRHGATGDPRATLGLALALRRAGETLEADDLARALAPRGRADSVVAMVPVPDAERAARRAVALAAIGDREGARAAWQEASMRPVWTDHARAEIARLEAAATPAQRPRPRRVVP